MLAPAGIVTVPVKVGLAFVAYVADTALLVINGLTVEGDEAAARALMEFWLISLPTSTTFVGIWTPTEADKLICVRC
jgi:hypothetical protein